MKKLYCIRDVLAGYGCIPGVPAVIDMPTDDYAKRVLKGSVAKGQKPNALNQNPEDKELWCIGEFDELTGKITACTPYLVGRAIDFIGKDEVYVSESSENADRA